MSNATTTTTTLASRAAALMSKATALGVVEKALNQAIVARRVHPAMAEDFAAQLGHDLPLKTRDFVRVVGHLLQTSEKPLKGVISKRKAEIIGVLAELVAALTDTQPVQLPEWAVPKERAKKEEQTEASTSGALEKANILAAAESAAEKAEKAADLKLSAAVALIVSRAAELTEEQRARLAAALATTEDAPM